MTTPRYDVVVIGAGNAALCAALAAREGGSRVLVLEKAPREQRGGNSWFTDGAIRFAFESIDDIRAIIPAMRDEEADAIVVPPYPAEAYLEDMREITSGRTDERLAAALAGRSFETMRWLAEQGVAFAMIYDNQSFEENGKHHFWGNLNVKAEGRGVGLMGRLFDLAEAAGVEVWYEAEGLELRQDPDGRVTGVVVGLGGERREVAAGAVVIASGGFEANREQRGRELGEMWEHAVLRGTSHNTGGGLRMALAAGARRHGQWSGCHSIGTDAGAPREGDYFDKPGDIYKKHSYPLGLLVNRRGERFVDEGADFRNYTYARYGAEILRQPGHVAYQIFDDRVRHLLRAEYWRDEATRHEAATLEELADRIDVDEGAFLATVRAYNAAVRDGDFNPHERDGKGTEGITPPKSNWANPVDRPPFLAFPVTCGITFTFGGVKVSERAEVVADDDAPIAGLFAAGEMVGGLFYDNYPGGAGLMAGAVFGKLAGEGATRFALGARD